MDDGRRIEVFYGRDLVLLDNYPKNTPVHVEVIRGGTVVAETTQVTDGDGFLEVNHVGEGDCWGPNANDPTAINATPDIVPDDQVVTSFDTGVATNSPPSGVLEPDDTFVRNVTIEEANTLYSVGAPGGTDGTITVTGLAKTSTLAPILLGTDVVEPRLNKIPFWSVNGRKDIRGDVTTVGLDGRYTFAFDGLSDFDVTDAQPTAPTTSSSGPRRTRRRSPCSTPTRACRRGARRDSTRTGPSRSRRPVAASRPRSPSRRTTTSGSRPASEVRAAAAPSTSGRAPRSSSRSSTRAARRT